MSSTTTPAYLAIGHITRDLLADGSAMPGGTSLYAARIAQLLGKRAAVYSARPDGLAADALPDDLPVVFDDIGRAPTFENRYTPAGRVQLLHQDATLLHASGLPTAWRAARIVHLAPVLGEVDAALVEQFPDALLGLTPQGLMRAWDIPLPGRVHYTPWLPAPRLLARVNLLVLSIADVAGDEAAPQAFARHCRTVAVTRGVGGLTLYHEGEAHTISAYPATEIDPTGAGDVFAAAMLIMLEETGDPFVAARFAAFIAARSVEGSGTAGVPSRAAAERGWRTANRNA